MSLADEIAAIDSMKVAELRACWRRAHKLDPPRSLSANLLRGALVYDLQAARHGGLSPAAARKLARIAARLDKNPAASALEWDGPAPGARLVREWGGKRHEVDVLHEGFAYRGTIYASLSEIARLITGAHWSGPRFFGLKNRRKPNVR
jgi:hypothetical protein